MFPLVLLCVILSGPLSAGLQVCLLVWVTCLRKGESSHHYSHPCILQTSNERTTTVRHISQIEPDILYYLRKIVRLSNDNWHVMFDSMGESSSNKWICLKHPSLTHKLLISICILTDNVFPRRFLEVTFCFHVLQSEIMSRLLFFNPVKAEMNKYRSFF